MAPKPDQQKDPFGFGSTPPVKATNIAPKIGVPGPKQIPIKPSMQNDPFGDILKTVQEPPKVAQQTAQEIEAAKAQNADALANMFGPVTTKKAPVGVKMMMVPG